MFKYNALLFLTLCFAVMLRLFFYMGPSGGDDIIYFSVVEKLLLNENVGETISSSKHWGIRIGMIFPVWAAMKVFGVSHFSSYLFPMLASIAVMISIYVIGLRLFNPLVALLSVMVFALLPQDVYLSAVIYPDGPIILFALLFIYLFYRVSMAEKNAVFQSIAAGLVLGAGYYVRETAVILLFAVPLLFFKAPNKKNYIKSVFFMLTGLAAAILVEMAILWWLTGEPLMRFNILLGESKVLEPREFTTWGANYSESKSEYNKYLFEPLIVILATHWISPLMLAICLGLPILYLMKNKGEQIFSIWDGHFKWIFILTFGILAYYTYGPVYGLTVPLKRSIRYYHLVTPSASIVLGVILYELLKQQDLKRYAGYVLIVFYISASFFCMGSIINKNAHGLDLIDKFITQNPADTYIMPVLLQKTVTMKKGLHSMDDKIVTYSYNRKARTSDRLVREMIDSTYKEGAVQYVFLIPRHDEIRIGYLRQIKWPMEKLEMVTKMTTDPSISCRILKKSNSIYKMIPDIFKNRICYFTDVYVYKLI